jgi:hypothetical protein
MAIKGLAVLRSRLDRYRELNQMRRRVEDQEAEIGRLRFENDLLRMFTDGGQPVTALSSSRRIFHRLFDTPSITEIPLAPIEPRLPRNAS